MSTSHPTIVFESLSKDDAAGLEGTSNVYLRSFANEPLCAFLQPQLTSLVADASHSASQGLLIVAREITTTPNNNTTNKIIGFAYGRRHVLHDEGNTKISPAYDAGMRLILELVGEMRIRFDTLPEAQPFTITTPSHEQQLQQQQIANIELIGVDPDYSGRGIATQLVAHSVAALEKLGYTGVYSECSATGSQKACEKNGFVSLFDVVFDEYTKSASSSSAATATSTTATTTTTTVAATTQDTNVIVRPLAGMGADKKIKMLYKKLHPKM